MVNRDGSNLRRLTNNPGADITPTWSPTGTQIAFTSDRTGSPQIYVVGVDGLGLRQLTHESKADRATWSPAPYNEIAYAAQHRSGQRHQGAGTGDRQRQAVDVRRRDERESLFFSERSSHRVQLDAFRKNANLHHGARRQGHSTSHASRHELPAQLVELGSDQAQALHRDDQENADAANGSKRHVDHGVADDGRADGDGLWEKEGADRAADRSSTADRRYSPRTVLRRRLNRYADRDDRAAGTGPRRGRLVGFTRRFEPQFAVKTGILRTRQQRSLGRGSARARWQCRRAQTARHVDDYD